MTGTTTDASLQVESVTGTIGAVVSGIDLAADLPDATMRALEDALHEHAVLFFRDQHLDDEQHLRFGRWFGELDVHHSGRNDAANPEIYVLQGYSHDIGWHTDITFEEQPARASVLRAITVPRVGGDTIWASTAAAYDDLSSAMQRFVDGLHAYHDSSSLNGRDPDLEIIGTVHPVVIDHPWTGRRCLFVNPMFTRHIVELTPGESRRVLELLHEKVRTPSFQVRVHWEPGMVAMWDNLATQHFVVVDYSEPRKMQRVTIRGPRPTSSCLEALTATA